MSWKPAMPPVRVTVSGKAAVGVRGGGVEEEGEVELPVVAPGVPGPPEPDPQAARASTNVPATRIRTAGPIALVSTSATSCSPCAARLSFGATTAEALPFPLGEIGRTCPSPAHPCPAGPGGAGLGSAAGFPFHDPSMTRMNSWTFSSTKRATCSRRTACRCWPAPSPRPPTRPARRRRRSGRSGGVTVVKAQVKTGGRGKAGGVKVAKSRRRGGEPPPRQILGMDIKGHTVHQVMVAQGAQIAEEYYFSVLLDRANRSYLAMASKEGGMEIEVLAVERPEALARVAVDPIAGIDAAKAAEIVDAAGLRRRRQGRDRRRHPEAVDRLPRRGRDARRGQPAGQDRGRRRSSPSTAR